jgi:intracellular multiplication protein IcmL
MSKGKYAVEGIDPLISVELRNDFYQNVYRKATVVLFVLFLMNLLLGGLWIYMIKNPPKPYYFATTVDGLITPLFPLNEPNQSNDSVLKWATGAAEAAFTYNYSNYRREFQSASSFFTGVGWAQFLTALKDSNNLTAVLKKKLVVSAQASKGAKILSAAPVGGRYAWRLKVPLLVTYQSTTSFSQQYVDVVMLIRRVSTLNAPAGIGIEQLVVGPAE